MKRAAIGLGLAIALLWATMGRAADDPPPGGARGRDALVSMGTAGWALAAAVAVVAALLAWRQWRDRLGRDGGLSDLDADHFARQDVRRLVGAAIMGLIAAGIAIGSSIDPRAAGGRHRLFVWIWAGVILSILVMVGLAWVDWMATFAYARRARRAIEDERRALIEAERRRRSSLEGGPGRHLDPLGDGPPA